MAFEILRHNIHRGAYAPKQAGGALALLLFPTLLLTNSPWHDDWIEQERRENTLLWRSFFPVVALVYIGHYYFFDRRIGLKPDSLWFTFRMTIAALSICTSLLYFLPRVYRSRFHWVPAAAMLLLLCYTQARTMVWYESSQYLYAFAYVVVSVVLLRPSILNGTLFAGMALLCQWPSFLESNLPLGTAVSGLAATFVFVAVTRMRYSGDIRFFLATRMNVEAQARIIKMNADFTDRIRAFLPREISARLSQRLSDNRLNVLQAVDDVLRPRRLPIACLFFDIRRPNNAASDHFLKQCDEAIGRYHGVPRKVGDLLFAYFDNPNQLVNLVRCVCAAFEISNASTFASRGGAISMHSRKHVLISSGPAIVGNLGGYESSVEITALGSPVNLLSRISEITKLPRFGELVNERDIVICPEAAHLLSKASIGTVVRPLLMSDLGTRIRDYEEMDQLYLLCSDLKTQQTVYLAERYIGGRGEREVASN